MKHNNKRFDFEQEEMTTLLAEAAQQVEAHLQEQQQKVQREPPSYALEWQKKQEAEHDTDNAKPFLERRRKPLLCELIVDVLSAPLARFNTTDESVRREIFAKTDSLATHREGLLYLIEKAKTGCPDAIDILDYTATDLTAPAGTTVGELIGIAQTIADLPLSRVPKGAFGAFFRRNGRPLLEDVDVAAVLEEINRTGTYDDFMQDVLADEFMRGVLADINRDDCELTAEDNREYNALARENFGTNYTQAQLDALVKESFDEDDFFSKLAGDNRTHDQPIPKEMLPVVCSFCQGQITAEVGRHGYLLEDGRFVHGTICENDPEFPLDETMASR